MATEWAALHPSLATAVESVSDDEVKLELQRRLAKVTQVRDGQCACERSR